MLYLFNVPETVSSLLEKAVLSQPRISECNEVHDRITAWKSWKMIEEVAENMCSSYCVRKTLTSVTCLDIQLCDFSLKNRNISQQFCQFLTLRYSVFTLKYSVFYSDTTDLSFKLLYKELELIMFEFVVSVRDVIAPTCSLSPWQLCWWGGLYKHFLTCSK